MNRIRATRSRVRRGLVVSTVLALFVTTAAAIAGPPATTQAPNVGARVRPIPTAAVFTEPGYDVWCGTAVRGDDGKCHLFYSRWPRELGHKAWVTHSEVAHAIADGPFGPFKPTGVALPERGREFWDGMCTHNPTVLRAGGKYYLYYMGNTGDRANGAGLNFTHRNSQRIGVAVADKPEGPWQRFDHPLIDVSSDADAPDALMVSNPAVCQCPDGSFLMVYKAVGKKDKPPGGGPVVHLAATSSGPTGPFTKRLKAIFTVAGVKFPAEDPFIWYDGDRYLAIVKDNAGYFTGAGYSLSLFESADGFDWTPAKHPLVTSPKLLRWEDGPSRPLLALERPQLYFENGQPTALFCAAADRPDRAGSFNVQIPLSTNPNPPTTRP